MLAKMKREESSLFKEHEAAYEVYLEVPEMHPSYEDKYSRFLQSYKKKYNTTEESEHMTKMWHKYWKLCIDSIKSKEWKKKRKDLIEKCRLEARSSTETVPVEQPKPQVQAVPTTPATPVPKTLSSAQILMEIQDISSQPVDDFSVGGALDILDVLSDKMGEIGPTIKRLVEHVKIYGLKNKKAMDLICESQNVLTLNLAFERILNLCQSLNAEQTSYCKKGIAWGLQLIKYAKNFKEGETTPKKQDAKGTGKSKKAVRFDLNLFAQQTYNQDSNWIYSTLEESLEYVYGAKPDSDLVKQMFANISAIHLNMSASTPYLMGGAAAASLSNNLGIVSHTEQHTGTVPMTPQIPHASPATFATPAHLRPPPTPYNNAPITSQKPPLPSSNSATSFTNAPSFPSYTENTLAFTNPPPPPSTDKAPNPPVSDSTSRNVIDAIMSLAKGKSN